MTGHVFVIQGDTRRFACDAYMYATDRDLRRGGGWMTSAPDAPNRIEPGLRADFQREARFTLPLDDRPGVADEPTTILTAVPYYGVRHASEFIPRIREFFDVASEIAAERQATRSLSGRERALLAVPLFGAGGGGANLMRGDVFRLIYDESRRAAELFEVDVAIVLRDPRDYALAQTIRRQLGDAWRELSPAHDEHARRLGQIAHDAKLVPFMGAGVSMSAGAPSWEKLLETLAMDAGIETRTIEALKKHDSLDQAAYVRSEFSRQFPRSRVEQDHFASAVIDAVNVRRYGIAPPLLAALEAEQAITLNYDQLFEWAAEDGHRPRRVVPGPRSDEERWLLKLHGSVDDPESIVLTRDDYLGFNADRAALSSLVKATLMTRHLLFVGFGVQDPHFHEIVHDVRRAVPTEQKFGTVLTTFKEDLIRQRLWERDLDFIHLETPRLLEIFLDAVLAYGTSSHSYLLAEGYSSALSSEECAISRSLKKMAQVIPPEARAGAAWDAVEGMLVELGWRSESAPNGSWRGLPEGLH
ncbi:SIR2 family protein [Microbacterium sp.]|uniref:SIR2 family NAD-dependent protein deacylase n=1 Tax=Microbacterium sp. TaxID=51671 RepID=UPI0028AC00F7|nr:SIR2 family protein [Microbacterium sp.]